MKALIYLAGVVVGVALLAVFTAVCIFDWRAGLGVGVGVLVVIAAFTMTDSGHSAPFTMITCRDVVAYAPNGAAAVCILHLGHPGQCATTLAALQKVGYTQPPF